MSSYSLNEAITTTTTLILFLKLHKLELSERLKDVLKVAFSDAEVNVANVKPMKRDGTISVAGTLYSACLSVLLGFRELSDDGYP